MKEQLIMQSDKHYTAWIGEVCRRFKRSQIKASIKVNTELLRFYFSIGYDLHIMKEQFGAGNEFYSTASKDLSKVLPDVKSFSPTNLKPPFSVENCLSIGLRHVRRSFNEGGSRPCEG